MIELRNISKYYSGFQAIHDMSFSVHTGEIVGLLGPNGAGKTTVMKMITGYHNPHSGTVRVCDVNVMDEPVKAKQHVGYLPEHNPLYEDLFVYEYLRFVGLSRGVPAEKLNDALGKVIELCSLSEFLYKSINSLSKGMRQRVGLAQAIIHEPDVVILDEPTSGLDPNQIKDIRAVIRELGKTKTVMLSTHILQEVEILCNRILIVNKGRIVAEGTSAEIAAKLKGEEIYTLALFGNVQASTIDTLKAMKGIVDVTISDTETDGTYTTVHVNTEVGIAQGEDIFDWAVAHKVRIRTLYKKSATLESIFESITSHEGDVQAQGGNA